MGIIKRGRFWHYRIWVQGREYTGTTGLAATAQNKKRALQIAEERRREIIARLASGPELPVIPFDQAAGQFLAWARDVEYRAKPNTARRIQTSFASIIAWFADRPISEITPGAIEDYKAWRAREHMVRDVTIRHDLHALSLFFKYCMKHGWVSSNPVDQVAKPSDRDSIVQHVVTPDEESAYFAVASGTLYDVARLILLTGARPEEILSLRRGDVDLQRRTILIRGGKTRAARRTMHLLSEACAILERRMAMLRDSGPDAWLFPSTRRPGEHITKLNHQHDEACRRAGVSFRLYDLRHTFATRLAEAGCDINTLAAILGHSGLRLLTRYVHPTEQHRAAAMERLEEQRRASLRRVK
ncbi:MAG: integrase [Bryobacteraceae bacterium]|nr:MAG: integrase [Bryobacteraceae bacterium]